MLDPLLDWEYPHWMMVAGAILVAAGFIGLAFHRNRNVETAQREQVKSHDAPEPETDLPEDAKPEDVPLFLRSDKTLAP